jgi:hypothetical protein
LVVIALKCGDWDDLANNRKVCHSRDFQIENNGHPKISLYCPKIGIPFIPNSPKCGARKVQLAPPPS